MKREETGVKGNGSAVETSVDELVDYLREHGETDADSLAKALDIDENVFNVWMNALEEANVVKVRYKLAKMLIAPVPKKGGQGGGITGTEVGSLISEETIQEAKNFLLKNKYEGQSPQA